MNNLIIPHSYYHLSFKDNLHQNVIFPKLPDCINESSVEDLSFIQEFLENTKTPRFCMSPSIIGCLNSLSHLLNLLDTYPHLNFYVYQNKNSISNFYNSNYLHANGLVFDAYLTKEVWILEPIALELVGTIEIDKSYFIEKYAINLFNQDNMCHPNFSHYKYIKEPKLSLVK